MPRSARYVELNQDNFQREVLETDKPVVVDFWAAWCPPCRILAPVVEEVAAELDGTAKVAKLDVDEVPEIACAYDIQSIPTLLFFHRGKVVDRVVGAVRKQEITERLRRIA